MRSALSCLPHAARPSRRTATVLAAIAAVALLGGCAKRDSITVGSVPDDYRTNHPMIVSEQDEVLDLPVGLSEHGMTRVQRVAVDGYVSNYDRGAGAVISIMVPANSANAASASSAAYEIAGYMQRKGIPAGRIVTVPYDAGAPDQTAPIRLVHGRMKAHVGQCGRWPDDLLKTRENKHYANFGCAYQNNLAAQLANPSDLLGPRASTEIDAANRGVAIEDYQSRKTEWTPVTQY